MQLPARRRIGSQSPRRLCVATAFVVFAAVALADEPEKEVIATTPGTSYSRSSPTGWTASTSKPTGEEESVAKSARPTSSLTIRAYEGFGTLRPYIGDQQAYGVDVTAQIEKCANGTDRISALNIGGWQYEVDGDCSDYRHRSRVSVSTNGQTIAKEASGEPVLRCDPATSRCRAIDPEP